MVLPRAFRKHRLRKKKDFVKDGKCPFYVQGFKKWMFFLEPFPERVNEVDQKGPFMSTALLITNNGVSCGSWDHSEFMFFSFSSLSFFAAVIIRSMEQKSLMKTAGAFVSLRPQEQEHTGRREQMQCREFISEVWALIDWQLWTSGTFRRSVLSYLISLTDPCLEWLWWVSCVLQWLLKEKRHTGRSSYKLILHVKAVVLFKLICWLQ